MMCCRRRTAAHPTAIRPMTFVNEVVSDADIDAYGLGLEKGKGHWWTRDKERDLYLWGGRGGNPLWGQPIEGSFRLHVSGVSIFVGVSLGKWSEDWHVKPFVVAWDKLLWIDPPDCAGLDLDFVLSVFKEALIAYGRDGRLNRNTPDRIVRFGF